MSKENILKNYEKTISYIASRLTYDKDILDDLKQEGAIGLLYAIDNYNSLISNNKSQHSFFCDNIRYKMLNYLNDYSRTIRTPRNKFNGDPEARNAKQTISIDNVFNEEDENSILDIFLLDDNVFEIDEDRLRVIINEIYKLTPYQQKLFKLHFFDGYSKTDLSKMIIDGKRVTRQSIGQTINGCVGKIKTNISKNKIKL
jgi:RNA polymerase sigma factor (sigma-70 family)